MMEDVIVFLVRRVLVSLLSIMAVSVVSFLVVQPTRGDSVNQYLDQVVGQRTSRAAAGAVAAHSRTFDELLRAEYDVRRPVVVRYARWAWGALRLDYGRRFSSIMQHRLLNTVLLALGAIVFTWTLGLPIGIYSAVRHNTSADYAVTFVGFFGLGDT